MLKRLSLCLGPRKQRTREDKVREIRDESVGSRREELFGRSGMGLKHGTARRVTCSALLVDFVDQEQRRGSIECQVWLLGGL